MRVLLTGSSGLLGSVIAQELTARQHEVYGIDLRPGPWTGELVNIGNREAHFRLALVVVPLDFWAGVLQLKV
ncbi:hypothetical protein KSC_058220 [Ktedonobacter sp. SOSP1-52]|uniref:NAD(P)-dependent oxidoreductase n=1 Tax=Ktedonobacter sp. SOSP1-52 TaxID=2778366 RepID=UPI00191583B1|nr:NAD(P)-dependent oxidoreductase [Ktedonobacter sp. SOSP1-52]GHO66930.1 hypothetical protein KSC_058220 [Ktedonobacter sp. SOSP1-52]